MKLFHLADLHLGKSLYDCSLIESGDQDKWVTDLLDFTKTHQPDAVLIAGDVYDRGVPAKEAVTLLTRLLTGLADQGLPVFLVAGNHDGGERLEFAAELLSRQNIYIAGQVTKLLPHTTLRDEYGPVDIWLMPYLFPAAVRDVLDGDESITGFDAAARALLAAQPIDPTRRNVLVAHQLVVNGEEAPRWSGSETSVGGVGQIDVSALDAFTYAALGHIHGAGPVGRPGVRYAGSPLCYHFSEIGQVKGPLLVTLGAPGTEPTVEQFTLAPLHPLREIRGELEQLILQERANPARGEFIRAVLTDERVQANARETLDALLKEKGSRLMEVVREAKLPTAAGVGGSAAAAEKSVLEHFMDFYSRQTGGCDPEEGELALLRFAAECFEQGGETTDESMVTALVDFALKEED